jgi:hypothetical protein
VRLVLAPPWPRRSGAAALRIAPGSAQGSARGLPGVARFAGVSAAGIAPARLYDRAGRVVGSENAQFLTGTNVMDCNTPAGLTRNHFSSVIELFGIHGHR